MKRAGLAATAALIVLLSVAPMALAAGPGRSSAIASARADDVRAVTQASALFQAEEGAGQSHEELFKWINFLIMAGALAYFLRKPLSDFFADRLDSIRKGLDEGRRALAASEAKLAEVEKKLANVEQEIAAFRVESERHMQAERERLKQSANLEAQRIMEFAQVQIESATRLAKLELKKFAATQAVELAEVLIRQRLDDPTRQRLVGNFVADLKGSHTKN